MVRGRGGLRRGGLRSGGLRSEELRNYSGVSRRGRGRGNFRQDR